MCGRFAVYSSLKAIREEFSVENAWDDAGVDFEPNYNIAPSQSIPVVVQESQASLALFRWGLIPSWAKDPKIGFKMINARAETILEKPSFRSLMRNRRCIIPADGFFEWKKTGSGKGDRKQPFYFRLKNGAIMGFAGLWDEWNSTDGAMVRGCTNGLLVRSCTIITTSANALVGKLHDRMPVILDKRDYARWLDVGEGSQPPVELLDPFDPAKMEIYQVTDKMNVPSFNNEKCIRAL
ncbi:SOS response-associated peptidase [Candidatus Woesearchaeota archaeon]|nr:SOS response-associated peptidase [Candidatus Woesearchaeota archaeon]